MSSQVTGSPPPAGSQLTSTGRPAQTAQPPISDATLHLRNTLISTLEDTSWPRRTTAIVQDFLTLLRGATNLTNIPKEEAGLSDENRRSLNELVRVLEDARPRLERVSATFGAGTRRTMIWKRLKHFFTAVNRNQCVQVLEFCRNEIERALVSLPDRWIDENATANNIGNNVVSGIASPHPIPQPQITGAAPASVTHLTQTQANLASPTQTTPLLPLNNPNKRSEKRQERLDGVKTTCELVEGFALTIPVVGSYVGAAAKVGSKISDIILKMGANEETAKALESHASELGKILGHFEDRSLDQRQDALTIHMNQLQVELRGLRQKVEELNSSGFAAHAFSSGNRAETLKGYQETIRTALEEIQLLASLNTTSLVTELHDKETLEERQRLLDRLGDAKHGARGVAVEDVICLEGTRVQVLERINTWIRDTTTSERVLWIRGMAGRGKSTIATTIAHQWKYKAACAIFYFRRGQNELDQRLVCALARQLGGGNLLPEVKESILQSIRENQDIAEGRLLEQFQTLFVRPLGRVQNTSQPILLIVDALDECRDVDYAVKFARLIERFLPLLPSNIKFLLTTRPEAPLIRALEPCKWHEENLDAIKNLDPQDITRFFKHGFSLVRDEYGLDDSWPPTDNVQTMTKMSQGLFQWARAVIGYLMGGSPQDRLRELMDLPSICDGMDELYSEILQRAFNQAKKNPRIGAPFLRVIGMLVVAPYPTSLETIAFFCVEQDVFKDQTLDGVVRRLRLEVLVGLGSLIHIPPTSTDPLHLMHSSIRDLLVDKERVGPTGEAYWVNVISHHGRLATDSLRFMIRDLQVNICNLSDLSKGNSETEVRKLV